MINKVILVGRVGNDPEVRALPDGGKVARLNIATSERFYNKESNTTTEHTEWHTVQLWAGLADVVDRWVHKGDMLYIEGNLRTREWLDKENRKHYTTEISARELKMLGGRTSAEAKPAQEEPEQTPEIAPIPTDPDGLPF